MEEEPKRNENNFTKQKQKGLNVIDKNLTEGKKPTKIVKEAAFYLHDDILKSRPLEFLQQSTVSKEFVFQQKEDDKLVVSQYYQA